MTDTTIRVTTENRQRLKMYASKYDETQDEALERLLNEVDAPVPEDTA